MYLSKDRTHFYYAMMLPITKEEFEQYKTQLKSGEYQRIPAIHPDAPDIVYKCIGREWIVKIGLYPHPLPDPPRKPQGKYINLLPTTDPFTWKLGKQTYTYPEHILEAYREYIKEPYVERNRNAIELVLYQYLCDILDKDKNILKCDLRVLEYVSEIGMDTWTRILPYSPLYQLTLQMLDAFYRTYHSPLDYRPPMETLPIIGYLNLDEVK